MRSNYRKNHKRILKKVEVYNSSNPNPLNTLLYYYIKICLYSRDKYKIFAIIAGFKALPAASDICIYKQAHNS